MKGYNLESKFTFGKFEGKTLREVIEVEPSYIDWCSLNLDHFYISANTIEEVTKIVPNFTISEKGREKLAEKLETIQRENEEQENSRNDYYSDEYDSPDNSPYYNDSLDMDQQSSEFWDNL